MEPSSASAPPSLETRSRIRAIHDAIEAEDARLRAQHPWLNRQDLLGMGSFLGSLALMVLIAAGYLTHLLPWWATVPLMALPLSILHELEHDLIHQLYFRHQKRIQDGMFWVIWWSKLHLNPWVRRELHLRHHKRSGQNDDLEERLIGLGLPLGLLRLVVSIHPAGAVFLIPRLRREVPDFKAWDLFVRTLPVIIVYVIVWRLFFGYVFSGWMHPEDPFIRYPEWGWPYVQALFTLWIAPNLLRHSSLVLMSSYSHYFGDIPSHDVFYQNQILRHWMLWPLQLFCFNFGATHVLHHYVVDQPFYLRQWVSKRVEGELIAQGVRKNDGGTIARSNRWGEDGG